jgi:hypothetical protein
MIPPDYEKGIRRAFLQVLAFAYAPSSRHSFH